MGRHALGELSRMIEARDYTRSRETTMGNLDPDDWRVSVVEEVLVDSPIAHEDPDFASLLEGVRILLSPHEAGQ